MRGGIRGAGPALPSGRVAFVFTDIEDSTVLFVRLGDAYRAVLAQHDTILRGAVVRWGGVEVKSAGDGLFLAFADPVDAVNACADAQRALHAAGWPDGVTIRVRMGVHVGPADPDDGDYVALAVNQAARVSAAAHGGQVLLSEEVRRACGATTDAVAVGSYLLKGFTSPQTLSQLVIDGLGTSFPPPRARPYDAHNLPVARTRFIGRSADLVTVREALQRGSLVTICGPGGAGKTRLALEVCGGMLDAFADGVWLVELAQVGAERLVAGTVAEVLRLADDAALATASGLARAVADVELLLVLDNCEHVLDAAAEIAEAFLVHAPSVRILATSREPLHVQGEHVARFGSLSESDGVCLLYDRVGAVRVGFEPGPHDAAAARDLHIRLEGSPLALELAAARAGTMSLPEIAAHLDDPLRQLSAAGRGRAGRHVSLRAMVDWSHDLLEPAQRVLLRRLAVFAGPVGFQTIERACRGDVLAGVDIREGLDRLVDRNLVVAEQAGGRGAHRLLAPVRSYAYEQLERADETIEARRHLLDWAIELAEAHHDGGGDRDELRARIGAEQPALLEALVVRPHDVADPEGRLRLAGALARRWAADRPAEAIGLLERALADAPGAAPEVRLRALSGLARVFDLLSDAAAARRYEEQALALVPRVAPSRDVVWAQATYATQLAFLGEEAAADAQLAEAGATAEVLDDDWSRGLVLRRTAYVRRARGDHDGARDAALGDLAIGERIEDGESTLSALIELAIAANDAGDGAVAEAYGQRIAALARQYGLARTECLALTIIELGCTLSGEYERATTAMAEAIALARGHGLRSLVRDALDFAAVLLVAIGRPGDAAFAQGAGAAFPRDSPNPQADAAIVRARAALDPAVFAAAEARGRAATSTEADRQVLAAATAATSGVAVAETSGSVHASRTLGELRDLARGIHPAVLTDFGLAAALEAVSDRAPLPIVLATIPEARLGEAIEAVAYFACCEAISNAVRHAQATRVRIEATVVGPALQIVVSDDGRGGAKRKRGGGLQGIADRVEAVGGRLAVHSPPGTGTAIAVELPLR